MPSRLFAEWVEYYRDEDRREERLVAVVASEVRRVVHGLRGRWDLAAKVKVDDFAPRHPEDVMAEEAEEQRRRRDPDRIKRVSEDSRRMWRGVVFSKEAVEAGRKRLAEMKREKEARRG